MILLYIIVLYLVLYQKYNRGIDMRITGANWNDFEAIRDCKHQQTFPILNVDALDVICTKGVDIEGKGAF